MKKLCPWSLQIRTPISKDLKQQLRYSRQHFLNPLRINTYLNKRPQLRQRTRFADCNLRAIITHSLGQYGYDSNYNLHTI